MSDTLLDHLARLDDPEPSKAAAGLDHSGLCARALVALVRRGLAVDTGMKRPSTRGVPVTVFAATREGREVARGC